MRKLFCQRMNLLVSIFAAVLFCSQNAIAANSAEDAISFESDLFQQFNVNFKMGLASLKYPTPRMEDSKMYFEEALVDLSNVQEAAPESAQGRLGLIEAGILTALSNIEIGDAAEAREDTVRIRSQMYLMHLEHDVITTEDYLILWHNGVSHRVDHMTHAMDYEELKWMKKSFMDKVLKKFKKVPYNADPAKYHQAYRAYVETCVSPFYEALAAHNDPYAMVDPENAPTVLVPAIDETGAKLHSKFFGAIYLDSFYEVDWPTP